MTVFTLWRPATSTLKLHLIEGAVMWSRLVVLVFVIGTAWYLFDARFVFWRVGRCVLRDFAWCGGVIAFERFIR